MTKNKHKLQSKSPSTTSQPLTADSQHSPAEVKTQTDNPAPEPGRLSKFFLGRNKPVLILAAVVFLVWFAVLTYLAFS